MLQSMGRKEWNSTERLNNNNKAAGFLGGSAVKSPPASAGVVGLIPGPGRCPEDNGNPLQYSCLGNPMDRGSWHATLGSQRVGHNLETEHARDWTHKKSAYKRRITVQTDKTFPCFRAMTRWFCTQQFLLWHRQQSYICQKTSTKWVSRLQGSFLGSNLTSIAQKYQKPLPKPFQGDS